EEAERAVEQRPDDPGRGRVEADNGHDEAGRQGSGGERGGVHEPEDERHDEPAVEARQRSVEGELRGGHPGRWYHAAAAPPESIAPLPLGCPSPTLVIGSAPDMPFHLAAPVVRHQRITPAHFLLTLVPPS